MYPNIVVGYDGTEEARDALVLASVLRAGGGIVTAACVPAGQGAADAERTLKPIGDGTSTVPWLQTVSLPEDCDVEGLLRLVHDTGADLFVLGSSQAGEAGRTHTGPVGRRLLFGCPCPVAVAPKGFRDRSVEPQTVQIAFEREDEAASAVDEGVRLAQWLGAGVRLLCLVPPLPAWALGAGAEAGYSRRDVEQNHLSSFDHILAGAMALVPDDVPAEGRLIEGRPVAALAREVERGGDLLVMASPGARPAPCVRPGTTAIGVLGSAPCPVLLTPTGVRAMGDRRPSGSAAS